MAISNKTLYGLRSALDAFKSECAGDPACAGALKDATALDSDLATYADQKESDSKRTDNSFASAESKSKNTFQKGGKGDMPSTDPNQKPPAK